jgi:hypothetical protein
MLRVHFLTEIAEGERLESGPSEYGMLLSCIGPGVERLSIGMSVYRGFSFWAPDPYSLYNMGIPKELEPDVLIIGGGDGGLQDFLRTVTRMRSPADIYKSLPLENRDVFEKEIFSAEDQANRAYIWNEEKIHDHYVHQNTQDVHQGIVDGIFDDKSQWWKISEILGRMLVRPADKVRVKLAYQCNHFTKCYGLNRFLTLLIAKYMEENQNPPLVPNTSVMHIEGVKHACGRPEVCHGKEHIVYFKNSNCTTEPELNVHTAELDKFKRSKFNVIIIRNGAKEQYYILAGKIRPNPRHILPYHLSN